MKILILLLLLLSAFLANSKTLQDTGSFRLAGGEGRTEKAIEVHYHVPQNKDLNTKVLLVMPGAGRNGGDYRDAWINASEEHNVLILAPSYPETSYPRFWNYNLARMIKDVKINREKTAIDTYSIVSDPEEWLFNDFDRIFHDAVGKFELRASHYDMFGHSAGGQILHRLALSNVNSKARRILSSNSGWYTVPTFIERFPYGLKAQFTEAHLPQAIETHLTIFLGELDNEHEHRGHLVRNPQLDIQGTHRLDRGKHFFSKGRELASQHGLDFNWKLHLVPGVGHDYRKMSAAAAVYLYSN